MNHQNEITVLVTDEQYEKMTDPELMHHVRECKDSVVLRCQNLICKKHDLILEKA